MSEHRKPYTPLFSLRHQYPVHDVVFLENNILGSGDSNGVVTLWSLETRRPIYNLNTDMRSSTLSSTTYNPSNNQVETRFPGAGTTYRDPNLMLGSTVNSLHKMGKGHVLSHHKDGTVSLCDVDALQRVYTCQLGPPASFARACIFAKQLLCPCVSDGGTTVALYDVARGAGKVSPMLQSPVISGTQRTGAKVPAKISRVSPMLSSPGLASSITGGTTPQVASPAGIFSRKELVNGGMQRPTVIFGRKTTSGTSLCGTNRGASFGADLQFGGTIGSNSPGGSDAAASNTSATSPGGVSDNAKSEANHDNRQREERDEGGFQGRDEETSRSVRKDAETDSILGNNVCMSLTGIDDNNFISGWEDGSLALWDIRRPDQYVYSEKLFNAPCTSVALVGASNVNSFVWASSTDGELRVIKFNHSFLTRGGISRFGSKESSKPQSNNHDNRGSSMNSERGGDSNDTSGSPNSMENSMEAVEDGFVLRRDEVLPTKTLGPRFGTDTPNLSGYFSNNSRGNNRNSWQHYQTGNRSECDSGSPTRPVSRGDSRVEHRVDHRYIRGPFRQLKVPYSRIVSLGNGHVHSPGTSVFCCNWNGDVDLFSFNVGLLGTLNYHENYIYNISVSDQAYSPDFLNPVNAASRLPMHHQGQYTAPYHSSRSINGLDIPTELTFATCSSDGKIVVAQAY